MRAGAYTIHQSLTAEAAAVLKLALGIARRRGHAQVTPLHVAFALLSPACSPSPPPAAQQQLVCAPPPPYGLLKRACLRSHPAAAAAAAHPLQCRALELCFNVALNRLPTSAPHSPPPSSASSVIQPNPTLSNALIAALKRAQANQRRGCVELQQQPPPQPPPVATTAQQQQQPLLAIKVELDQLIISILDDPSVSRVMREAGFSSSTVKSNLEEESALMMSTSSSPPPPAILPHFFLDPSIGAGSSIVGGNGGGGFMLWPAPFLSSPGMAVPSCKEDVREVLEVMVRKQGKRTNPVVVGDSVSMAEAVTGELLRRLEGGDVPDELAGAHLLKLQLSYVHVRLMSRADVNAKAAELRRSVDAVKRGGLVVYVGDLRWALDEDHHHNHHPGADHHTSSSYSPVDHMVAELGRLLGDLRTSAPCGRVWLVATASYQTYMRCRRRRPSLESAWALQAVVVPTGAGTSLALNNLHTTTSNGAPVQPAMAATKQRQQQLASPFAMAAEPMAFAAARDEQDDKLLVLCTKCSRNYEREAETVKAEKADEEGPRTGGLPCWLVPEPPKENYLIELKRKWSRLCRKLHLCGGGGDPCSAPSFGAGAYGSGPRSLPWWSASCLLPSGGGEGKPSIAGFLSMEGLRWTPPPPALPPHRGMSSLREPECQDVTTALALGSLPLSDSASSTGGGGGRALGSESDGAAARELERRLRKNVPWQRATVAEIANAVTAGGRSSNGRKGGVWLFLKGSDHTAVRRAAAVIAETHCGSADRVVSADPKKFGCAEVFCSDIVSRASMAAGGKKLVLVVHDVEHAPQHVIDCLVAASRSGALKDKFGEEIDLSDSIVVLTTSKLADAAVSGVINLRLYTSEEFPSGDLKRKTATRSPPSDRKRARHSASHGLDLNLSLFAEDDTADNNDVGDVDDDDDAVPSDITHESDSSEHGHSYHRLLESVATRVVTLDSNHHGAAAAIRERLSGQLDDGREFSVDGEAAEALAAASGHFVDEVLERWVAEVFEPAAAMVKNGGKVVVLGVGRSVCGAQESGGFMGSVLPSRVHVD